MARGLGVNQNQHILEYIEESIGAECLKLKY